jgi:predicted DNA repair protein MutK
MMLVDAGAATNMCALSHAMRPKPHQQHHRQLHARHRRQTSCDNLRSLNRITDETFMAASSLLALIDDIATILDDVAVMSKVAAKKTAGVLGDDLALNAQQVAGVAADRELPVVWSVAKGSMWNKLILVPAALAISAFVPWAITPLLMFGGAFLCYEGAEKLVHRFWPHAHDDPAAALAATAPVDEAQKIKGAIRTDFILSAEIIVIALGTVSAEPFMKQVAVLSVVAVGMTIGVYGLVAGIVKIDDAGLALSQRTSAAAKTLGRLLLAGAPVLMKLLSVLGTAAMFMVGGSILVHGLPPVQHGIGFVALLSGGVPGIGLVLDAALPVLLEAAFGFFVGLVIVAAIAVAARVRKG